ncbi:MAG: PEGA domain-containing protein [Myxococcales bacterium FL481]|nr:MAG: PEGA domain-containing protein [Myxococcales bacterium FL481]
MPFMFAWSNLTKAVRVRVARWCLAAVVVALLSPGCRGGATNSPQAAAVLRIEVVEADQDADVYVDGNYVGQVRGVNAADAPIQLAEGTHRVEIRKPGRFPVQRTVDVRAGGPATVSVRAELLGDPR